MSSVHSANEKILIQENLPKLGEYSESPTTLLVRQSSPHWGVDMAKKIGLPLLILPSYQKVWNHMRGTGHQHFSTPSQRS